VPVRTLTRREQREADRLLQSVAVPRRRRRIVAVALLLVGLTSVLVVGVALIG